MLTEEEIKRRQKRITELATLLGRSDVGDVFAQRESLSAGHFENLLCRTICELKREKKKLRQAEMRAAWERDRPAREAEEAERKRQRIAARAQEVVQLKAQGKWHCEQYETIKAAKAEGWQPWRDEYYGGSVLWIKGHKLCKGCDVAQSMTAWKREGFQILPHETPHAYCSGSYSSWAVYRRNQVEPLLSKKHAKVFAAILSFRIGV